MGTLRKSRKLWASLAALVFAATLGTIITTQRTASAATMSNCTSYAGTFCLFSNENGSGALARYSFATQSKKCLNVPGAKGGPAGTFNDTASSAYFSNKRIVHMVQLFKDAGCKGPMKEIGWSTSYDNLSRLSAIGMNNTISSIKLY